MFVILLQWFVVLLRYDVLLAYDVFDAFGMLLPSRHDSLACFFVPLTCVYQMELKCQRLPQFTGTIPPVEPFPVHQLDPGVHALDGCAEA